MRSSARIPLAIAISYLPGLIGFLYISPSTNYWYQALNKPALFPPNWVFAVVWPILYGLMAISLLIMWPKMDRNADANGWVRLFFVQLMINAGWTIFFFGLHAVFTAMVDSMALFLAVMLLIMGAGRISKIASWMLVPYLLWVAFATYLNASIWILN